MSQLVKLLNDKFHYITFYSTLLFNGQNQWFAQPRGKIKIFSEAIAKADTLKLLQSVWIYIRMC